MVACEALVLRPTPAAAGLAMAAAMQSGSTVTGRQADLASKPTCSVSMGLAFAGSIIEQLDDSVRETLSNARAPSSLLFTPMENLVRLAF